MIVLDANLCHIWFLSTLHSACATLTHSKTVIHYALNAILCVVIALLLEITIAKICALLPSHLLIAVLLHLPILALVNITITMTQEIPTVQYAMITVETVLGLILMSARHSAIPTTLI